jgi:hypothetical protein
MTLRRLAISGLLQQQRSSISIRAMLQEIYSTQYALEFSGTSRISSAVVHFLSGTFVLERVVKAESMEVSARGDLNSMDYK